MQRSCPSCIERSQEPRRPSRVAGSDKAVVEAADDEHRFPLALPQFHKAMVALRAGTKVQAGFASAMARFQIEGLSFLQDRLEKNLRFASTIAAAPGRSDSLDVLNDFAAEMVMDYARQMSRFFTEVSLVAQDAAVLARSEAERTITDIAARSAAP